MKAYGFLRRVMGGLVKWAGGLGGGPPPYHYGWPSGGTLEPDVAAQWLFDEASGNIVDEVGGVSLSVQAGTPTYNVSASGLFSGLSPGISCDGTAGFHKDSATASLDLGTNDFVIECWTSPAQNTDVAQSLFDTLDGTDANGYVFAMDNFLTSGGRLRFRLMATTYLFTPPFRLNDGVLHKIRIVADRSGNAEIFCDGQTAGTNAINAYVATSIPASSVHIFERNAVDHKQKYNGSIFELRVTIGNLTNNSGGPGGG